MTIVRKHINEKSSPIHLCISFNKKCHHLSELSDNDSFYGTVKYTEVEMIFFSGEV